MRPLLTRLAAAWRVLVHGPSAGERSDGVFVPLGELRDLVQCSLAGLGLPYWWCDVATSEDLERLSEDLERLGRAVEFARRVREGEWDELVREVRS